MLYSLGFVDPSNSKFTIFKLDQGEPRIPSFVSFQVLVTIQNVVIHRCIIDEGTSTCVMSTFIWNKLGAPTLQPSNTSLHAYDGRVAQPQGVLTNVSIELEGKTVFIDIEVVNS